MIGRVVSAKLKNTVTVLVERTAKDPLYGKTFVQTKKYLVDDLLGVKEGDIVEFTSCKPVSKNKHWKVIKVVGKNLEEINAQRLKEEAEKTIAEVMPEEKESVQVTVGSEQPEKDEKKKKPNKRKESLKADS